ncbi:MAG: AMP-dependent synthetase/ligase [Candidatus Neomarinimicrobiota bacterium]
MNTPKYLIRNLKSFSNESAISLKDKNGNWETENWFQFSNYVISIAKSMISSGIQKNDKISILSYNRKEWYGIYVAAQYINAVPVGIYHTSSSNEIEWVVSNSNSKIIFVGHNPNDNDEKDKMPIHKVNSIIDSLPKVETFVIMKDVEISDHSKAVSWENFLEKGLNVKDSEVKDRLESINDGNTSSLIYTSGTTGNPKGVELTHKNWRFELDGCLSVMSFDQGEKYVSWLPLAHVFGQLVDIHFWIRKALHMHLVDSPLNIIDYAKEIKPHFFISVPRIYEKVYSNFKSAIDSNSILKFGLKVPGLSSIFKNKLKQAAGFSEVRFAISGAAPINKNILKFFQEINIPLFEGYGMTENTAGASLNYYGNNKIGSVGKAIPNTEIKIENDGEILLKGDHVMKGYYNNNKATNETLIDNWLHTGDVGFLDKDGYLFITGRKKEIYVSSAGKNIAPLIIEETMKSIPFISQCFLIGDNRKFCSALFTLDIGVILRDEIKIELKNIPKDPSQQVKLLSENGYSVEDFSNDKKIILKLQKEVDKLNSNFSNPEQLKKFSLLNRDFSIDYGELTPTMKIRRKQILENWSEIIESMY